MVTVPAAEPLANPFPLIDATFGSDELHVTELLMSDVVPSERWAVATNCWLAPIPIDIEAGEISSEEIDGVVDGGGVLGVCECPLDAQLQPQFSDASNKTPMQLTTFMKSPAFLVPPSLLGAAGDLQLSQVSLQLSPARAEVSIVP